MKRLYLLTGFFLFIFSISWGKEICCFDHLTIEDGLSQNTVGCIIKDALGYMWFGTNDGLNRYNGYEFVNYRNQAGDSTSISDNKIYFLFNDTRNRLWIGTRSGLNLYDQERDCFIRKRLGSEISQIPLLIKAISEDRDGKLWIGTLGNGLWVYDTDKEIARQFSGVKEKNIFSVCADTSKQIYVASGEPGLYFIETIKQKAVFLPFPSKHNFKSDIGKNLFIDQNNNIWIGTEGLGLYSYDPYTSNFHQFPVNIGDGTNNKIIKGIREISKGEYWIITDGGGLNIYNSENESWQYIISDQNNKTNLNGNALYSIYKDDKDIVWLGTFGNGINIVNPNKKRFHHYYREGCDDNTLTHNAILSFLEDQEGNIWIGTDGGGINILNRKTGEYKFFRHASSNSSSVSSDVITSLYSDSKNNIWVGTFAAGLNLYEREKKEFKHYLSKTDDTTTLRNNNVWDILEDHKGNLWIATLGGLHLFDAKKEVFHYYMIGTDNSSFHNRITCLLEDSKGRLWFGGNNFGMVNRESNSCKIIEFSNTTTQDINKSLDIRSIFEDSEQNIWIGTEGSGLKLYDEENNQLITYNTTNGLPNNAVHQILEDDKGFLWISTNSGLSKFDPKKTTFTNYDADDGLQSNQFSYSAALKLSTGEMLFGGVNGFNLFHPDSIHINKHVPEIYITDLLVSNQLVKPGDKSLILDKTMTYTRKIVLPYKSVFTLKYTAINYTSAKKNEYKYQLAGFSSDWINAGNQRSATYTNLDQGEYKFTVIASNEDDVWNTTGASVLIKILPPIWKTGLAYVIYFILVALLFWVFRNFLISRQKMKHDLLIKDIEKKKITEINQAKLQFFTNVSHELKTPLSLIIGPLEKLIENNVEQNTAHQFYKMMQKNAHRLLNLINQLLEFRRIDSGNQELIITKSDVLAFISEIKAAFNDFAEQHHIDYQLITEYHTLEAWYDRDKLDKILFNLLSNAFKFTPDRGSITIKLQKRNKNELPPLLTIQSEEVIEISVRDTGIGISPERITKIFNRFYQIDPNIQLKNSMENMSSGIGLALTKSLVELHHGIIIVESEVNKGSVFRVILPYGPKDYQKDQILQSPKERIANHKPITDFLSELNTAYQAHEDLQQIKLSGDVPKILLIEDNEELRNFIKYCLASEYDVYEAANGNDGMDSARAIIPDLIVSDIMMPEMDGFELVRTLKNDIATSHIPVILLTALSSKESEIEGLKSGAYDFIQKPFDPDKLILKIANIIQARRKLREKIRKELLMQPKEINIESADEIFLRKALEIVENHINDSKFDVKQFGDQMNMSRSVLYRKMIAVTGQSANEFIRSLRLKRAAQLLRKKEFTISEITYQVGFNDPQYFSKCFSKEYGITPSAYAAQADQTGTNPLNAEKTDNPEN